MVEHERDLMHGLGWMDREQRYQWQLVCFANNDHHLHACLRWNWGHY